MYYLAYNWLTNTLLVAPNLRTEQPHQDFYLSFVGTNTIIEADDIHAIHIRYQPKDVIGNFIMPENEEKSLFQIHIAHYAEE